MRNPTRSKAITDLFQLLETKFGNIKALAQSDAVSVITRGVNTSPAILPADLHSLFTHRTLALHVKGFYPPSHCDALADHYQTLANQGGAKNWMVSTSRGLESSDVSTIGTPSNMAMTNGGGDRALAMEEYHQEAQDRFSSNREIELSSPPQSPPSSSSSSLYSSHPPLLHPLDKLRLELDEAWAPGANVAKSTTAPFKAFNAGLPRIMVGPTRFRKGFIHVDDLSPMVEERGTFSANIYLRVPPLGDGFNSNNKEGGGGGGGAEEGGDGAALQIWPCKWSQSQFYLNAPTLSSLTSQSPDHQTPLRQALGQPVTLNVEAGDLVIICVQRPHAVVGFKGGSRISLQSFINYGGVDDRLTLES
jgi:hypothetical protein